MCKADLEYILEVQGADIKIEKAELELLRRNLPDSWNVYVEGNMELRIERDFEQFLFSVAEHTKEDVENMTTYRFYHLIDYIKKKQKNKTFKSF